MKVMYPALWGLLLFVGNPGETQTMNGCYIGAYLGRGAPDSSYNSPAAFNAISGKNHYCFSRYINAGDDNDLLNSGHWQWADTLKLAGANPVFFLMPFGGLGNYANGARDASLERFADSCAGLDGPVYLVFGHEMNGSWNPFGGTASDYVSVFQHVSSLMRPLAPNIRMCWVAIQAYGQNAYLPFYPGDSFVDWVGLNLYDRDYDENNQFYENQLDSASSYLDFYHTFSEGKNKPMMIGENSLFDPNRDPTLSGQRLPLSNTQQSAEKNEWIASLYNKDSLQSKYPNLNMIIFFNVRKHEEGFSSLTHNFENLVADWRIPFDSGYNIYSGLIQDNYFIGATPAGIEEQETSGVGKSRLKIFPNPCHSVAQIEYSICGESGYSISLNDRNGRQIRILKEGMNEKGHFAMKFSVDTLAPGGYVVRLQTALDDFSVVFVKPD